MKCVQKLSSYRDCGSVLRGQGLHFGQRPHHLPSTNQPSRKNRQHTSPFGARRRCSASRTERVNPQHAGGMRRPGIKPQNKTPDVLSATAVQPVHNFEGRS